MNKDQTNNYGAEQITVLEGLEPVRKRPGMFIGGTGREGLHHLIWEVLDNSIEEAMGGFCDTVQVTINEDNSVTVIDNGRGIPIEKHPKTGKSTLETVLTVLHAGGKFGQGGYKVSGGLHGVGVSVVNALSEKLIATVTRDGKTWQQEFKRGNPLSNIKSVETPPRGRLNQDGDDHMGSSLPSNSGTSITFLPDPEIFHEIEWDWKYILEHVRQQAYLTKGVHIILTDSRASVGNEARIVESQAVTSEDEKRQTTGETSVITDNRQPVVYHFYFEGGIKSYVRHLSRNHPILTDPIFYVDKSVEMNGRSSLHQVEVALSYVDMMGEKVLPFANNIHTIEGGTQLTGFRAALNRVINAYAQKNNLLPLAGGKTVALQAEDIKEGLVAVISVKLPDPQFEGQTKSKLGTPEIRSSVDSVFSDAFSYYLEENPHAAQKIIEKSSLSLRARLAAKAARETVLRKGALEGMTLPGKLADCSTRNAAESELFIVEGDSAGGSAKMGRDRRIQAILPLKGKILNVERARLDRMLASDEIKAIIIALGIGVGEEVNYQKLRYHKLVIMTDADVDGSHIRTLLLTLFYRHFPKLIEQGHIYIAQPPLFGIFKGKSVKYVYSEAELQQYIGRGESMYSPENTEGQTHRSAPTI